MKKIRTARQYEAQQEALLLSAAIGSVCPCGRKLDEVDIQFKQCYECGRYWGKLTYNGK